MAPPHSHGPVATPMPDPPPRDFMSEAAWDALYALLDGCLPSIAAASASQGSHELGLSDDEFSKVIERISSSMSDPPSKQEIADFLAYRPLDSESFRTDCLRTLANAPQKKTVADALNLLTTNYGSLLLTGYWSPITKQPAQAREAIIKSWFSSRLASLRTLAKSMAMIAQKANATTSPHFQDLAGYSDTPVNWKAGDGYDFRFVQVDAGEGVYEMETDVVIVGSGCGGAVSAKNVAEAGLRTLVIDKGYYFPPSQLPMPQNPACKFLFDADGVYTSDDAGIAVLAGSCWGGGGTVNWSVCFRPQPFVREEWAADTGLPFFTSRDFDECLDRVWHTVGASADAIRHNHRNQALLDGCAKLGWRARPVEQNTGSKEHFCGQCHLGCGSAEKRGPTVTWLPAAAEAGAEFMEGFEVERVIFAEDKVTAIGIEGLWTSRDADGNVHTPESSRVQRRVRIKAGRVILSGGSLWSPVLLMKSGVENPNVGRNLHLHPVNIVVAAHQEPVRPWEGGIITSFSDEFENLDGKGHGVKLEPLCMMPYMLYTHMPWVSGLDAKLMALKYRHLNGFISLTRDRDSGRVYADPRTGRPRIEYVASDFDRDHTLEGVEALAKVCYVEGATEIRPALQGLEPFVPADGGARQRAQPAFGSAHQMGSCRMSGDAETGVVDGRGKVWGREGLYVADASVFPSASGVNPMVTTMALADWISRGVAAELSKSR
ncbi:hypothetical protein HIM_01767 [Hirsutella minnesotensis 3608]|nr:hypothetical protein HIM_01767 [Hirsutella minnesotensis 3608]